MPTKTAVHYDDIWVWRLVEIGNNRFHVQAVAACDKVESHHAVWPLENLKPLVSAQFGSLLRHRWMCRSMMLMYLDR